MATYLGSGLGVAMIGLSMFAVPEIVDFCVRTRLLQGTRNWPRLATRFLRLVAQQNTEPVERVRGVIVGIVPGLGGSVVDWIAYGQTKAIVAARGGDMSQFGKVTSAV